MKNIHITSSLNSPEINFNFEKGEYVISGQSIITDVQEFYAPIVSWLEMLSKSNPASINFKFHLNYYNIASAKRFMFMIYLLSKMKRRGTFVLIEWQYLKDDEFMKEFGEDLADRFEVPIKLKRAITYVPEMMMAC